MKWNLLIYYLHCSPNASFGMAFTIYAVLFIGKRKIEDNLDLYEYGYLQY